MIDVYVGSGNLAKQYHIHRGVVVEGTRSSLFFQACLQEGFKEGKECKIVLSDEIPVIFDMFIEWAYGADVKMPAEADTMAPLVQLWVFADKYFVEQLMNDTITKIAEFIEVSHIRLADIVYVYENTLPRAKLRDCIVSNLAYDFCHGSMDKEEEMTVNYALVGGGDFALEFAYVMREYGKKNLPNPTVQTAPKCQFHVHEQTKRCTK